MMSLKNFYFKLASAIPLSAIFRLTPVTSVFPYHHIVSDEYVPHIKNLYSYKNVKQFQRDLDFLLKNFKPIGLEELFTYITSNNRLPHKKFLLTFDDGFREVKEVIAPILHSKGIPAIFFINPAFIDNKEMFYRNEISLLIEAFKKSSPAIQQKASSTIGCSPNLSAVRNRLLSVRKPDRKLFDDLAQLLEVSAKEYLQKKKPWLTKEELFDLSQQGFTIGAHSWNHPYYENLTVEEQLRETISSLQYVSDITGREINSFSFPHSDERIQQNFFDALKKSNKYPTLLFGIQNQKMELNNAMIHRFNAERPEFTMRMLTKGIVMHSAINSVIQKQNVRRVYA